MPLLARAPTDLSAHSWLKYSKTGGLLMRRDPIDAAPLALLLQGLFRAEERRAHEVVGRPARRERQLGVRDLVGRRATDLADRLDFVPPAVEKPVGEIAASGIDGQTAFGGDEVVEPD